LVVNGSGRLLEPSKQPDEPGCPSPEKASVSFQRSTSLSKIVLNESELASRHRARSAEEATASAAC
jgi:hypothetical protein